MTLTQFQNLLSQSYYREKDIAHKTPQDNASRIISWLRFAGLIDYKNNWWLYKPVGEGKDKGKFREPTEQLELKLDYQQF